jgi:hypothetical protein
VNEKWPVRNEERHKEKELGKAEYRIVDESLR